MTASKTKDPARDFDAYRPAYSWFKTETYFHEVEQGFRMTYASGLVVDVSVYRDHGETKWIAEVEVNNGPGVIRDGFKTMRTAKVWAECAMPVVRRATDAHRALMVEQLKEREPYTEAARLTRVAVDEVSKRHRVAESEWLDSLAESVTIPESNFNDGETA